MSLTSNNKKAFFTLSLVLKPTERLEALEFELLKLGALSLSYADAVESANMDAVLEPELGSHPFWSNTKLSALFPSSVQGSALRAVLKRFGYAQENAYAIDFISENDWQSYLNPIFDPIKITNTFWVVDKLDPQAQVDNKNRIECCLPPGLAFGTGAHPSTYLCLKWLAEQQATWSFSRVRDLGCGSGILSIACGLLGAKEVLALDYDPQAIESTKRNAVLNEVVNKIEAVQANLLTTNLLTFQAKRPQLTIANILLAPLLELAEPLARSATPSETFLISGVLTTQAAELERGYAMHGIQLVQQNELEGWGVWVGQKQQS